MKAGRWAALGVAAAVVLGACGSGPQTATSTSTASAPSTTKRSTTTKLTTTTARVSQVCAVLKLQVKDQLTTPMNDVTFFETYAAANGGSAADERATAEAECPELVAEIATVTTTVFVAPVSITMAEFEQIQTGQSYDYVVTIIGGPGELSAESSAGGFTATIYTWDGAGSVGANANVTFQNGLVAGKAQSGLK